MRRTAAETPLTPAQPAEGRDCGGDAVRSPLVRRRGQGDAQSRHPPSRITEFQAQGARSMRLFIKCLQCKMLVSKSAGWGKSDKCGFLPGNSYCA
eukprot:gene17364-38623_t